MTSPFKSRALMVAVGSGIGSALNFYTYLVLPSLTGTVRLSEFVQDNYLGGLYLFSIGSSAAPLSIFIFTAGRKPAFTRYLFLCLAAVLLIGVGGQRLATSPLSYLCLLGGMGIQSISFLLAAVIRSERMVKIGFMQSAQPGVFACLASLSQYGLCPIRSWAWLYLISSLAGLVCFVCICRVRVIREQLAIEASQVVCWKGIIERIALSVSFPLFFQLELILCGRLSSVDVATYMMLQKLYSSISISLFSSVGILLLTRRSNGSGAAETLLSRSVVGMALACSLCVPFVGGIVLMIGKHSTLSAPLVLGGAAVAFLFTLCSFVGLKLTAFHPFTGLQVFGVSLAVYVVLFMVCRPSNAGGFLTIAGLFFGCFLGTALLSYRRLVSGRDVSGPLPALGTTCD